MDSLTDATVESRWNGPRGNLDDNQNGRITTTAATKGVDGSYSSKIMISPLHVSDAGRYSCNAGVTGMSEFISPSDRGTHHAIINVNGNRTCQANILFINCYLRFAVTAKRMKMHGLRHFNYTTLINMQYFHPCSSKCDSDDHFDSHGWFNCCWKAVLYHLYNK